MSTCVLCSAQYDSGVHYQIVIQLSNIQYNSEMIMKTREFVPDNPCSNSMSYKNMALTSTDEHCHYYSSIASCFALAKKKEERQEGRRSEQKRRKERKREEE